jgi:hypothetical protein
MCRSAAARTVLANRVRAVSGFSRLRPSNNCYTMRHEANVSSMTCCCEEERKADTTVSRAGNLGIETVDVAAAEAVHCACFRVTSPVPPSHPSPKSLGLVWVHLLDTRQQSDNITCKIDVDAKA